MEAIMLDPYPDPKIMTKSDPDNKMVTINTLLLSIS
jgi:hypothetical protein